MRNLLANTLGMHHLTVSSGPLPPQNHNIILGQSLSRLGFPSQAKNHLSVVAVQPQCGLANPTNCSWAAQMLLLENQAMNCLKMYRPKILHNTTALSQMYSTSNNITVSGEVSSSPVKNKVYDLPEEPTTCCMSGCANCVWIEYAEQLSKLLNGRSLEARALVLAKVSDPNMRAFLLTELRALEKCNPGKPS